MLNLLTLLLRDLFLANAPGLGSEARVGFRPPNEDWRTFVSNLGMGAPALNIYLIDLRENRKLRQNDRLRTSQNGVVSETPAPIKMDCHYLISAWSPAQPAPGVEPTLDEHGLLFDVVATLAGQESLNPSRVYAAGSPRLAAWPEPHRDREMPMMYLPVEGFRQFAEFWQTMGANQPWKPAAHVVVTLPTPRPSVVMGGVVTTWLAGVGLQGGAASAESLIGVGGIVRDPSGAPVAGAWVRLEKPPVAPAVIGEPIQIATTDALGRFAFDRLGLGDYVIRARAPGHGEAVLNTTAPSPTGGYVVQFS